MMPLRFFKIPAFSAGNTVAFSISLGMFATFFFLTIYMQSIHGFSPSKTGIAFLPLTLMIIVTAPNAGKYASQHGSRAPMTFGLILAGTGLILLGLLLTPTTSYWVLFPIFLIMGLGMGATMAPMTAAVMNSVGPQRAGARLRDDEHEPRGRRRARHRAVGRDPHDPAQERVRARAREDRAHTGSDADDRGNASHGELSTAGLAPDKAAAVLKAFNDAFMQGFRPALVFAGLVLLVAALIANRFIPGRDTVAEHHAAAEAAEGIGPGPGPVETVPAT